MWFLEILGFFMHTKTALRTFGLLALLTLAACTKSPSESEGGGDLGGDGGGSGENISGDFRTNCGTVSEGSVQNPANPGEGIRGRVTIAGPNLVILSLPSGDQLIKLHNLEAPSQNFKQKGAMKALEQLASEEAVFFPASRDCTTTLPGGGLGTIGQVFTASGISYSEKLIESGVATLESDPCGGELIGTCYRALMNETGEKIAGELSAFLWKPVSDSNGKLAIHTGPFGTTVEVNGEVGTNQGSGNGFGSLARFGKSGCGYGSATVRVLNSQGIPYIVGGSTSLTIPNGCNRYCLQGGELVQCEKR